MFGKVFAISLILCLPVMAAYGQKNETQDLQGGETTSLVQATWVLALSTCVVGISTIVSVILYIRDRNKQNQTTLTLEVFKMLNDDEHRNARRLTYEAYRESKNTGDLTIFEDESHFRYITMTASDFDHVGSLIKNYPTIKKMFFDIYAETVIICWKALEAHIKAERTKRRTNFYMRFFNWLNDEAEKYWQENRNDDPLPEPY